MTPRTEEVPIHGIGALGAGVGRLSDGRTVFVPRTAPGDEAVVDVVADRPRWARGTLKSLRRAGPHRRTPPCPAYAVCGGCSIQHLEYTEQLVWKRRIVEEAFARIAGLSITLDPVAPSPEEFGYRTRISLTLRRLRGGRVVAGFHELERRSRVFDLTGDCLLAHEGIRSVWTALRAAWGPGARALPPGGELRLTLRQGEAGVALVVKGGSGSWDAQYLVDAVDGLIAVWHASEGRGPVLLAGDPEATERWLEEDVSLGATAFLQVNRLAGEALHRRVLEIAEASTGSVVDAYCGVGTYGRALARAGAVVTGIESDAEAVAAARSGAPDTFSVEAGTVEEILDRVLPASLVIVNPPRTGLAQEVVSALAHHPPARLIYVSCAPATLARDVRGLTDIFEVASAECFDLFPQTTHVETVVELARREAS